MANTYSKIYLHVVFAVKNRQSLIRKNFKEELYMYMTGIVQNHGQKLLAINGYHDHVHLLIGCTTSIRLDALIKEVKEHSTKLINNKRWVPGKFNWQSGYAAFSVSRWDLDTIFNYIANQEEHHAGKTFREEFLELLRKNDVDFDERYVFYEPSEVEG